MKQEPGTELDVPPRQCLKSEIQCERTEGQGHILKRSSRECNTP